MIKLPACLPDELVISRLIRYITISGKQGNELALQIFGSKRASFHPFLTAGINKLSSLSSESAREVLNWQTLAPLFSFFLPEYSEKLVKHLRGNNSSIAYRTSQLPSFASGSTLHLSSCSSCIIEDIKKCGVSYWHRIHQTPGLTACPHHGDSLYANLITNRQRLLPGMLPKTFSPKLVATDIEFELASFANVFLNGISKRIPSADYIQAYRMALQYRGFTTKGGQLRRQLIMESLLNHISEHRPFRSSPLPRNEKDYRYFSELLIPGSNHHPFRHLVFAQWLFKKPTDFLKAIKKRSYQRNTEATTSHHSSIEQSLEHKCLELLKEHHSLNSIQKLTGKSRCYLKRLALLNGISIRVVPRLINTDCLKLIKELAEQGEHRRYIAKRCGISVGSVEQVISSIPGLVERRYAIRRKAKRMFHRSVILNYRDSHPNAIIQNYKLDCNAAFFWLYTYDRNWLKCALPTPIKPAGRYPGVTIKKKANIKKRRGSTGSDTNAF